MTNPKPTIDSLMGRLKPETPFYRALLLNDDSTKIGLLETVFGRSTNTMDSDELRIAQLDTTLRALQEEATKAAARKEADAPATLQYLKKDMEAVNTLTE